jgi:hypothetical protein
MLVLMVLVVDVQMLVLNRLVRVHVRMAFREHEPRGQCSQDDRNDQGRRDWLVQQHDRECRSKERSSTEVRRCPCAAEMCQRAYE